MKRYVPKANQSRRRRNGHPYGWFYSDLYGENIHLIWNVTEDQLNAFLKWKFKCGDRVDLDDGKTLQLTRNKRATHVIALRRFDGSTYSHCTLAHEAFHCADNILKIKGLKLTDDTSEAYAYMVGWVVDQCLQIMTGKPR